MQTFVTSPKNKLYLENSLTMENKFTQKWKIPHLKQDTGIFWLSLQFVRYGKYSYDHPNSWFFLYFDYCIAGLGLVSNANRLNVDSFSTRLPWTDLNAEKSFHTFVNGKVSKYKNCNIIIYGKRNIFLILILNLLEFAVHWEAGWCHA